MTRKLTACLAITVIVLGFATLQVHANGFDADYYASKYPDVVAELGNDPGVLYQHYVTYGANEGRFQNKQEEIDSCSGQLKVVSIYQADQPNNSTGGNTANLPGGGTYIDVSIASQTVNYYQNGELKLTSPCVTGNVNTGNDTPTGVYSIMTHTPGKFLTGPTWNVWVDRWMRFTPDAAIGLHDATWRSNFGGDIYLTNGSHGCVNLPHEAACQLFDMVTIGTTVVVHQ